MAVHPYTRLFILPAPPDADNDETEGYEIGDTVHVTGGSIYECRDASTGAAVWEEQGSGGGSFNIHGLGEKTSLVFEDEDPIADSEDGFSQKKVTWRTRAGALTRLAVGGVDETVGITNEEFDTDASGWTLEGDWAWESDGGSGGWIRHTPGATEDDMYQLGDLLPGLFYTIEVGIGDRTAGTVSAFIAGGGGTVLDADGEYVLVIQAGEDPRQVTLTASNDFDGYVDYVTLHTTPMIGEAPNDTQYYARKAYGWYPLGSAAPLDVGTGAGDVAAGNRGVTNGDAHDHAGGDGNQVDHGGLAGLGDDDHTQYIKHSLATAADDFLVASGAGAFVKKTLAQTVTIIRTVLDSIYAAAANGVTNGDSHDHAGGDGAQIDHGGLAGLGDDDHTQYIKHALSTAANDFLVGSGSNTFIKKTLAETITILRTSLDSIFAPIAKGVTNGDTHNHTGGDGADLFYKDELGMWVNTTVAASTTLYGAPFKPAIDASTVNWPLTEGGTLSNLTVRKPSGTTQPSSGTLVITVLINNVASSLSVSFSNADGSAGATKTDTDEVAVSAGDNLRFEVKNNATGTSCSIVGIAVTLEKQVNP